MGIQVQCKVPVYGAFKNGADVPANPVIVESGLARRVRLVVGEMTVEVVAADLIRAVENADNTDSR